MPKKHQNDPRSAQKRPQEEPKTIKKAIPNDKTKKGPNQDDLGTILDRPRADLYSSASVRAHPWGGQNGTKIDPKTIKNRSENSRRKKSDPRRSWTRLGAILVRFGAPSWAKKPLKPFISNGFVTNHFFEDKTVRRRFRDQLGPNKAPT